MMSSKVVLFALVALTAAAVVCVQSKTLVPNQSITSDGGNQLDTRPQPDPTRFRKTRSAIEEALSDAADTVKSTASTVGSKVSDWAGTAGDALGTAKNKTGDWLVGAGGTVKDAASKTGGWFSGAGDTISGWFSG